MFRFLEMEERILKLCAQLLATEDPQKAQAVAFDLRVAIHDHIEELRQRVNEIPALIEPLDLAS